jgi:transmembrane sensor
VNKEILYRHIQGLTSAQEAVELEAQLKADPAMQREYELLVTLEGAVSNYQYPESNKKEVLENITQPKSRPTRKIFSSNWVRVAAILLAVFSVTLLYKEVVNEKNILTIMANQQGEMFDLPDGSKVWLQKGSELSYYNNSRKNIRQATLNGVGYFVVKPNDNKNFEVATSHLKVLVLGTEFEVGPKEVRVERGQVKVMSISNQQNVIIASEEKAQLINGNLVESSISKKDIAKWRVQAFRFSNEQLSTVVESLELKYQIKVIFDDNLLVQRFTFNFEGLDLEEVITVLQEVTGTKVKVSNREYRFKL